MPVTRWTAAGEDSPDAGHALDGGGRSGVVAGQHDDVKAHRFQFADGCPAGGLDGVGDGDHTEKGRIADKVQDGFPVSGQRGGKTFPFGVNGRAGRID